MVVVSARALVVEVRLGQRGGIGVARPAILLLAAIGGPAEGPARVRARAGLRNATHSPWEHSPALHQSPRLTRSKRVLRHARKWSSLHMSYQSTQHCPSDARSRGERGHQGRDTASTTGVQWHK